MSSDDANHGGWTSCFRVRQVPFACKSNWSVRGRTCRCVQRSRQESKALRPRSAAASPRPQCALFSSVKGTKDKVLKRVARWDDIRSGAGGRGG